VEDATAAGIDEETSSVQGSGANHLSAAGETPGHVLPGFTLATELPAKWSVATASSGLATMGVGVLLKGESCLLRFQTSLVRDLLKVLVFLFRRGSHSPTQLLQGLGERSCSVLVFSY
jgi:hypothetical protein